MTTAPLTLTVRIAEMMQLSAVEATVLPSAITVASAKVNMSEWAFAEQLTRNQKLREYVANICRQISA